MKSNNYFFSKLVLLSLLAVAFNISASECGVLRLQRAISAGTEVVNNACNDAENLAVESVVQLATDARAWFESISHSSGAARFKVICQNLSSTPVKIKLVSSFLPWLQPDERFDCGAWTNERLECKEPAVKRPGLVCAIAAKKMFIATHEIQRNTSVVMRSKDKSARGGLLDGQEMRQLESIIDSQINPKLKLCENWFGQGLTISWTIKADGQVANTAIVENVGSDEFALCALKAVESHVFPAYSTDVQVQSTFK